MEGLPLDFSFSIHTKAPSFYAITDTQFSSPKSIAQKQWQPYYHKPLHQTKCRNQHPKY
uniref:Uncharacterized protein n=1 Tax=Rhizophora mucronata TaxID=61149 RepID=A0A2P2PPM4_RHIMU